MGIAESFAKTSKPDGKPNTNSGKPAAAEIPPVETRPMARFVTDVTIPDGTHLKPEESFVKTWTLRNDGKGSWPVGSRLISVGGDNLLADGQEESVLVVPDGRIIAPGEEVEVSITLKAPSRPGRYVGHYRMAVGTHRFGHRVWADIVVTEQTKETPMVVAPVTNAVANDNSTEMTITPNVALAISASLMRDEQNQTKNDTADDVEAGSPTFVMVDPLPESLLEIDSNGKQASVVPADDEVDTPPSYASVASPTEPESPEPPVPPAPHKWATQLTNLADMGFFDHEILTKFLDEENGDVQRVIEKLLA